MKLSFDKSATRKLELLAISKGVMLEDALTDYAEKAMSAIVESLVDAELAKLKPTQPEKGAT